MIAFCLIYILFVLTISFKSEVYRDNENLLIYSSSTGLNKNIFSNQPVTRICTMKKQFFTKFDEVFSIRSRQGFFNVETFASSKDIQVTGIGTAKYDPRLDQYQSKVKVITICKAQQLSLFTYTLSLKLISSNETAIIQIPVSLSCYPQAYNVRIQYIILQFMLGIVFIILTIFFSNIRTQNLELKYQPLFAIVFLILPIFQKASFLFVLFVTTIFLQKLLFLRFNLMKFIRLMIISSIVTGFLVWAEMNFSLYSHYFINLISIYVGFISFRALRFRYLVFMLILFVCFIDKYKQFVGSTTNLQIVLSALFKNQNYQCVQFSLWNIIFPLVCSVFIIRSFVSPPIKNIHVLFHFIAFLGIGIFQALSKMGGIEIQSTIQLTCIVIVSSSCVLSLLQGNLKDMVKYRDISIQV